MRAVFDTNIFISSILSQRGYPFLCLQLARENRVRLITCQEILYEFEEKLLSKFAYEPASAKAFVDEIRNYSQLVTISNSLRGVSKDPDDDMIIECAVVGDASYIVTGDKQVLAIGQYQDIRIVKPIDFWEIFFESVSEN